MIRRRFQELALVLTIAGILVIVSIPKVHAVPSFKRQTGMACTACHTVWPELTPFGRNFKLGGYTFSTAGKDKPYAVPISAMFQASATYLNKDKDILTDGVAPFDSPDHSNTDRYNLPQQASLFYGGRIADNFGALVQVTYDGPGNSIALDMTDVRYARTASLGGMNLNWGFTLNNAPTVEDVWNSTPFFGFPFATSAVAPTPVASPFLAGKLNQQVGGIGAYAMWNNLVYGDFTIYKSTDRGITRPLGAGTDVTTKTDDGVPYWRFALQHQWGKHSAELGTYGIHARVHPVPGIEGPDDKFTDLALDAQYQFIAPPHNLTVAGTWIRERQHLDGSTILGLANNPRSTLDLFRANADYYYHHSHYGTFGGTFAYFQIRGDTDVLLFSPNPVSGSRTGSPNSEGFILQGDYVFKENYKFSLQYTIYTKFNGSSSDYDGFGRSASNNNTLFILFWLMF